jgi:hypothetical protein
MSQASHCSTERGEICRSCQQLAEDEPVEAAGPQLAEPMALEHGVVRSGPACLRRGRRRVDLCEVGRCPHRAAHCLTLGNRQVRQGGCDRSDTACDMHAGDVRLLSVLLHVPGSHRASLKGTLHGAGQMLM